MMTVGIANQRIQNQVARQLLQDREMFARTTKQFRNGPDNIINRMTCLAITQFWIVAIEETSHNFIAVFQLL